MAAVIAAPASGSGKTLLSLALLSWAQQNGRRIQAFKVGPDYLDAQLLSQASGQACRNLDLNLCGEAWVRQAFHGYGGASELTLVEGVMGLFDGIEVRFQLMAVPVAQPNVHAGQMVGLRLIAEPENGQGVCVILCAESGGCMRLEGGGMANLELHEEVVPVQHDTPEMDVARLLGGGHDSTNPLLAAAAPLAARLLG